jgi:hypothetical protein
MGRDLLAFSDVPSLLEAGVIGRSHCRVDRAAPTSAW